MTGGAVSRTASNTIASAEPELKVVYIPLWSAHIGAVPVRDKSRAGRARVPQFGSAVRQPTGFATPRMWEARPIRRRFASARVRSRAIEYTPSDERIEFLYRDRPI